MLNLRKQQALWLERDDIYFVNIARFYAKSAVNRGPILRTAQFSVQAGLLLRGIGGRPYAIILRHLILLFPTLARGIFE